MSSVSEELLRDVLLTIKEWREKCTRMKLDPWAVRQGLLIALELDAEGMLLKGVPKAHLDFFDAEVRQDFREHYRKEILDELGYTSSSDGDDEEGSSGEADAQ